MPFSFFQLKRWTAKYLWEDLMIWISKKGFEIAKNMPFSAGPQYFRRRIRKSWSRRAPETISISYANTYLNRQKKLNAEKGDWWDQLRVAHKFSNPQAHRHRRREIQKTDLKNRHTHLQTHRHKHSDTHTRTRIHTCNNNNIDDKAWITITTTK